MRRRDVGDGSAFECRGRLERGVPTSDAVAAAAVVAVVAVVVVATDSEGPSVGGEGLGSAGSAVVVAVVVGVSPFLGPF